MADKPKNCLLCGKPDSEYGVGWMTFKCGSLFDTGLYQFVKITETCKDSQIAQLQARIQDLENLHHQCCKDHADLMARNEKLEWVAEAAETLLQDKIILDTVCFPHSLFKKYQELSDVLKDLEVPR